MVDKAQLFRSLEECYGLPEGYLARTEMIESAGGKITYNKNTGEGGNFGFLSRYQKAYGITDIKDVAQSAEAAARLAAQNRNILQQKGIENPTAADLYAAHQQGATGYANLLKAGDKPAASVVGENAVVWNGGKPDMTASEFARKITNKFSGEDPSRPKPPEAPAKPTVDVAETPEQVAALEQQQNPALTTQEVLDTANASRSPGGNIRALGFLHNYFKSLDTSATGVKPLVPPDFFHRPEYAAGGIVSLKKDAERVRAAGIGGDTVLAHITAGEAALLKSMGGSGRINPRTGLPMFDEGEGRGDPEGGGKSEGPSTGENSQGSNGGQRDSNTSDSTGNTGGNAGAGVSDKGETSDKGDKGPGDKGEQGDKEGASRGSVQDSMEAVSPSTPSTNPNATQTFDLNNPMDAVFGTNTLSQNQPATVAATPAATSTPASTPSVNAAVAAAVNAAVNAPTFSSIMSSINPTTSMTNPNSTKSQAFDLSGPNMNTAPAPGTVQGTATSTGLANTNSIAGMGLSTVGSTIGNTAAPSSVSPSTSSTPSSSTTTSSSTAKSSGPTANSSTSKAPGIDFTGISFIDNAIAKAIGNPTATIAGLAVGVANPVAGLVNTALGNPIGMAADRAISAMTGTNVGYGNTVTSEDPGTTPSGPTAPGPSVGEMSSGGGGSSTDSSTSTPVSPTTSSATSTDPVNYNVANFLGNLGKSSYTTPQSVYSTYPVQLGIGSLPAQQYMGSFYNPTFGQVPYQ